MHVGPISDKALSLYLRVLSRIINKSTRFLFCVEMKECSRTPVGLDGLWGRGVCVLSAFGLLQLVI